MSDLRLAHGGTDWVLRVEGDELAVGEVAGSDIAWAPDRVPLTQLSEPAQQALREGRTDDGALLIAARALVAAQSERGG